MSKKFFRKSPKPPDSKSNTGSSIQSWIVKFAIFILGSIFVLLFLVPLFLITLKALCPQLGIDTAGLKQLVNTFDSTIGVMSLIVGVTAIFLSNTSSKAFDEFERAQNDFILEVEEKMNSLMSNVSELRKDNDRIYDVVINMSGKRLQDPGQANEE